MKMLVTIFYNRFETKPFYGHLRTCTNNKKYIKEIANKNKDVKICDTNPIHWTNNNHNRLRGFRREIEK
jgi:hypothetical protein